MISLTTKAPTNEKKPFTLPTGFFKMRILKSRIATSKKGNDMLVIETDISEGEREGAFKKYPLKKYILISNEEGLHKYKRAVAISNVGMVSPDLEEAQEFDETSFEGLHVGAKIGTETYNGKKKAVLQYFCSVDYVNEQNGMF